MAVLDIYIAYIVDWDRFIQVLYLGRAPRTKETLPDFLKWCRATRPSLVFRGLTGSQRTPEFWGVTARLNFLQVCSNTNFTTVKSNLNSSCVTNLDLTLFKFVHILT